MDGICFTAVMEPGLRSFDSTADELLTSYGWSSVNISWLWFYYQAYCYFAH